jgi:hypothetical protein
VDCSDPGAIEAVHFQGHFLGYDENGNGLTRDWHGFTKHRQPEAWLGTAAQRPFRIRWDTRMLPAQRDVAVRAHLRIRGQTNLVYVTAPLTGMEIAERPEQVTLYASHDLPAGFWSRANRKRTCTIYLDVAPDQIERAELLVNTWTGGAGTVKEYFKVNGVFFPVAEGARHELVFSRLAVDPKVLRQGINQIELLSDTEHHGIEVLLPGPCLMVRSKRSGALSVRELEYQGQATYEITTPSATYLFHRLGAGLASLRDRQGLDWISYRPGGGSAGEYRGIPNCGDCFHPGDTNAISHIMQRQPDRISIGCETLDGKNAGRWDIYAHHATFTMLRAATNYWFLYEGTPGANFQPARQFMVRSTGEKTALSEHWSKDIAGKEWLYVADPELNRSLLLIHHEDDDEPDQYWPMEGNMTVFGFGRKFKTIDRYLTRTPGRLSVALVESTELGAVAKVAERILQPPTE